MSLSTPDAFIREIDSLVGRALLPEKFAHLMKSCYLRYIDVIPEEEKDASKALFVDYLSYIGRQLKSPYAFSLYHQKITKPIDYEAFGKAFMRPLIQFDRSKLIGKEQFRKIEEQLKAGENVLFLANHQTEPDPQILLLTLCKAF